MTEDLTFVFYSFKGNLTLDKVTMSCIVNSFLFYLHLAQFPAVEVTFKHE